MSSCCHVFLANPLDGLSSEGRDCPVCPASPLSADFIDAMFVRRQGWLQCRLIVHLARMDDESKKTPGILIGYKGVKYGLQKRKTAAAPKPAIFGDDSSEDEAVDVQIAKEQQKHLTASKAWSSV